VKLNKELTLKIRSAALKIKHMNELNQPNYFTLSLLKIAPAALVLYFDCSDETMTERLLGRAKSSGRADDNEETIKKRLVTFHQCSEPVIQKYSAKCVSISANTDVDTISKKCFASVDKMLTDLGVPVPK
jgi:adenylate kinase family enzyme